MRDAITCWNCERLIQEDSEVWEPVLGRLGNQNITHGALCMDCAEVFNPVERLWPIVTLA